MHALSVLRPGQPPERRCLSGPARAGGSQADDIHLPGCPPSSLRLVPVPPGVVAEAIAPGIRVAGRPIRPGSRRLLRPGERAELHGAAIVLEPPEEGPTRVAAGVLLRAASAGEAPVAGPHLVVLSGADAGVRHPLGADQTLGRGRSAGIVIRDGQASRVHARIRLGAGGASVEDLASKNGVRVNGVPIERRACGLRPGDELLIGETALAVQDGGGAAAEPASRAPGPGARRGRAPARLLAALLLALSAAALALAAG